MNRPPAPELAGLAIADPPERWRALGFTVTEDRLHLGGLELRLGLPGQGIVEWTLRHVEPGSELDGLPTAVTADPRPAAAEHANGAIAVDHVVIFTPDFDRTATALEDRGMGLRRVRDAGGFRQGFRRLGPAIMEIVEAPKAPPGPARFWGLVVVVADVEALRERLGPERLGEPRPAVQPGRRIATLAAEAALSPAVAFMDPGPPAGNANP